MHKFNGSILVICNIPEDEKMYPHLYDLLTNLRAFFDELIYVGTDPRYYPLLEFDKVQSLLHQTTDYQEKLAIRTHLTLLEERYHYAKEELVDTLKRVPFKHKNRLVLAIDDHAFNCAMEVFPEQTVYWSFDILGSDCPYRIKATDGIASLLRDNGILARQAKGLIVQDSARKSLLEETLGAQFQNVLYLPVALNDSSFCKSSSIDRLKQPLPYRLKVVQSGHICPDRFSTDLILAFQQWPAFCELHLRGYIDPAVTESIYHSVRPVSVSGIFHDNSELSEVLNNFDVGFIGYKETDRNHKLIVNASSQIVAYMRLGIPLICCGSEQLIAFVSNYAIGIAAPSPGDISPAQLEFLYSNYNNFAVNARKIFDKNYNLGYICKTSFFPELEKLLCNREEDNDVPKTAEDGIDFCQANTQAERVGLNLMQLQSDAYYSHLFIHNEYRSNPQPNDEEFARWTALSKMLDVVTKTTVDENRLKILDVGCGRGWLTNLLSCYGEVEGVDPVEAVIHHARSMFPNLRFTAGTTQTILQSSHFEPFNIVACSEVIEHVPYSAQQAFVNDLTKLLGKNGHIIVTTPRAEIYDFWMQLTNNNLQPIDDWLTEGMLKNLFAQAGCYNLSNSRIYYDRDEGSFLCNLPTADSYRYVALYQVSLFKKAF